MNIIILHRKMNIFRRINQYRYYSYNHYLLKEKVSKGGGGVGVVYKEQYERMEPLDHVLLRPGMYVGQMEASSVETW